MAKQKNNTKAAHFKAKQNIVMFRLELQRINAMRERILQYPIVRVKSANQFARKILVDYLDGRLQYTDQKYRWVDSKYQSSDRYPAPGRTIFANSPAIDSLLVALERVLEELKHNQD